MKIYFLGAVSGLEEFGDNYRKIVDVLEESGHKVIADHIFVDPAKVQNLDKTSRREYFRKMQSRIKLSDIVVAEVSCPTANIGYEIAYALEREKPVLVLKSEDSPAEVFALAEGNTSDKIITQIYSPNKLDIILTSALEDLKTLLDVRYNFFISNAIVDYLNFISRRRRTPKSVYLRNLLEKDMQNDQEYQEYLDRQVTESTLDK